MNKNPLADPATEAIPLATLPMTLRTPVNTAPNALPIAKNVSCKACQLRILNVNSSNLRVTWYSACAESL